jgi:hypothetical protein
VATRRRTLKSYLAPLADDTVASDRYRAISRVESAPRVDNSM